MALPKLATQDLGGAMAMDARALSGLKQQARSAPGDALRAAAGQFEALFMQMLLKSMRDALPQDGPFASDTTRTYTAMFDQQLAQQIARKGIGVADLLVKQLSARHPAGEAPAAATGAGAAAGSAPARMPYRSLVGPASPGAAAATTAGTSAPDAPPAASAARAAAGPAAQAALSETARSFIEKMRPHAEAAAQVAGIPATFLLAQAALETGWGRHQPRLADGATSHNLFGIKAGAGWQGVKALAATTEYVAGRAVTAFEAFRSYGSYGEAFQDFARLIKGAPRYSEAVAAAGDAGAYAQGLQRAGYATDPRYAEKLTRAIEAVARHVDSGRPQVAPAAADKRTGAA